MDREKFFDKAIETLKDLNEQYDLVNIHLYPDDNSTISLQPPDGYIVKLKFKKTNEKSNT